MGTVVSVSVSSVVVSTSGESGVNSEKEGVFVGSTGTDGKFVDVAAGCLDADGDATEVLQAIDTVVKIINPAHISECLINLEIMFL